MAKKEQEEQIDDKKMSKETSTAFLTMFPTLIIGVLAIATTTNVGIALVIVALIIYQFLMQKNFIENYYKNR